MSRSVVLGNTPRCERCRLAPRWCICDAAESIDCPFQVDVLVHHREFWRPTSTGRLINRVIPSSRSHVFRPNVTPAQDEVVQSGHPLWVLHPRGEPLPAGPAPAGLKVLLLDGSWREAAGMMPLVEPWGRSISLPMTGFSRYWLREQRSEGRYSTIEALLFLLNAFGLHPEHERLRLQFELHVYAGLRARGAKALAEEFLATSPVREAFPELLEKLEQRRPRI